MNHFPRVLGVRTGYDPDQVDLLVRRIEGTLGRGAPEGEPITADEIRDARFRAKPGGYHEIAVDFALEAFIVAIETRYPGAVDREPVAGGSSEPLGAIETRYPGAVDREPVAGGSSEPLGAIETRYPGAVDREPVAGGSSEPLGAIETRYPGAVDREPVAGGSPEPLGADEAEEHAARVERVAFRPGRLGMGYNEDQVDAFLNRVAATLRGTIDRPLTPDDVRGVRFATVMLRPGYAVSEVDGFLADLAGVLEAHPGR
ncbi:DivIVA domain-containing protein [Streptosporangium sp. NBC_01755]|uniref:DivIVA domain-containing protein n=1 Tax=Streptosporangium sp. NBC_01755 TaxID=2975949 RepID=UPI002DD9A88C|nr:DivIVA domain-containing protein [Streptosporangium sp. NBC_01755]WSC98158.1 DivIVA domain-containing protein [Streptosporangium sp. NBC_01755]